MTRNMITRLLWQAPSLLCAACLLAPLHAHAADTYDAAVAHAGRSTRTVSPAPHNPRVNVGSSGYAIVNPASSSSPTHGPRTLIKASGVIKTVGIGLRSLDSAIRLSVARAERLTKCRGPDEATSPGIRVSNPGWGQMRPITP